MVFIFHSLPFGKHMGNLYFVQDIFIELLLLQSVSTYLGWKGLFNLLFFYKPYKELMTGNLQLYSCKHKEVKHLIPAAITGFA